MRFPVLLVGGVLALSMPLVAAMAAAPAASGPVIVVLGPFSDAEAVIRQAGGSLAAPVRAPLAVIASGPDDGFAERLRGAGAWAVMDAGALAFLCGADR